MVTIDGYSDDYEIGVIFAFQTWFHLCPLHPGLYLSLKIAPQVE